MVETELEMVATESRWRLWRRCVVALLVVGVALLAVAVAVWLVPLDAELGGLHLSVERTRELAASRAADPSPAAAVPDDDHTPVHDVILLIGDGAGIGAVSTTSAAAGGGLALEGAPVTGLVRTAALDSLVTDSAAGATALATGFRTDRHMLSVLPDGRHVRTLFEAARERGMAVGAITTSGLADATPAAFTAHSMSRDDYATVAEGMVASGAAVLLGGDWGSAVRAANSADVAAAVRILEGAAAHGYHVVHSEAEMLAAPAGPVLGLFPQRPGTPEGHGPDLATSTRWALGRLAMMPPGFMLVVESEETDEAAHRHDAERLVAGLEELDRALAVALDFASVHPGTLVILTADHDTGGLAVVGDERSRGQLDTAWTSMGHTGQWVPLFAFGAGAGRFAGVHDNAEVGRLLGELLELPDFPAASGG